jgi:hypothetical protein
LQLWLSLKQARIGYWYRNDAFFAVDKDRQNRSRLFARPSTRSPSTICNTALSLSRQLDCATVMVLFATRRSFVASLHTQVVPLGTLIHPLIHLQNMLSQEIEHPLSPTSPFEDPATVLEDPFRDPEISLQDPPSSAKKPNGTSSRKFTYVHVLVNIN